jgi:hypothetical protein
MYLGLQVHQDKHHPESDENFVYFTNKFGVNLSQFDERALKARFSKEDFADFIGPFNQVAQQKRRHLIRVYICFGVYALIIFLIAVVLLLTHAGFEGGIAFFIIGYIVLCFGGAFFLADCHKRIIGDISKYEMIITSENITRSHARGLHWTISQDGKYLELYLKYCDRHEFPQYNTQDQTHRSRIVLDHLPAGYSTISSLSAV